MQFQDYFWYDYLSCYPKVSIYHRRIYRIFLDILLYRVNIRKLFACCPLGVDYRENISIINSQTEKVVFMISKLQDLRKTEKIE